MERTLTEEQKEAILNFGAFDYGVDKMASILGWDSGEVKQLISSESEFSRLFQKGRDMAEYAIDTKLWNMALSGDTKAFEIFEKRKAQRNWI